MGLQHGTGRVININQQAEAALHCGWKQKKRAKGWMSVTTKHAVMNSEENIQNSRPVLQKYKQSIDHAYIVCYINYALL